MGMRCSGSVIWDAPTTATTSGAKVSGNWHPERRSWSMPTLGSERLAHSPVDEGPHSSRKTKSSSDRTA